MKRVLIVLALMLAMGCGGNAIKKDVDLCDQIRNMPLPELFVTYDTDEYNEYLYSIGMEISWKMQLGQNPACAYANVEQANVGWHLIGEYCADVRDDGLYMCEKACAFSTSTGEEVARSDKCEKVAG